MVLQFCASQTFIQVEVENKLAMWQVFPALLKSSSVLHYTAVKTTASPRLTSENVITAHKESVHICCGKLYDVSYGFDALQGERTHIEPVSSIAPGGHF